MGPFITRLPTIRHFPIEDYCASQTSLIKTLFLLIVPAVRPNARAH